MVFGDGAGAAGLIRKEKGAALFASQIEEIAYREIMGLDKVCKSQVRKKKNRKRRMWAHRDNVQQLLAFYLSVTERYLIGCGLSRTRGFFTAIADGVREAALRDPKRTPQTQSHQPISDYIRAFDFECLSQEMRARHPAGRGCETVPPDLVRETAVAIAARIVREPDTYDFLGYLSRIVAARLETTAKELLARPPYVELERRVQALVQH